MMLARRWRRHGAAGSVRLAGVDLNMSAAGASDPAYMMPTSEHAARCRGEIAVRRMSSATACGRADGRLR